ncbi:MULTISPECIES: helix-turn-helix domain-containing protein [Cyanophyceae]|uniref:helix-turn-helix domain-containing protein n=1 Tax=Cyanophyceae TaxID=3028117 RepID=UPI00016DC987|nr:MULTISPECIES: helix-turn-helix domain-containing protein [Cyanophyceae]ACA99871.1 hypothetical protein SYNPCC7002_A1883 [Picosynechococcus sp. PCC 7002]
MPNSPNSPWFPTSAMAQALGINPKTLIRNRKRFKEGHHYYNAILLAIGLPTAGTINEFLKP